MKIDAQEVVEHAEQIIGDYGYMPAYETALAEVSAQLAEMARGLGLDLDHFDERIDDAAAALLQPRLDALARELLEWIAERVD